MACLVLAMCIATLANVSMAAEKPEVTRGNQLRDYPE